MLSTINNSRHFTDNHKKGSRSKSLSRREDHGKVNLGSKTTSTQMLHVRSEDSVEVPVIVDDVTKWISGVNKNTTCRDIIRVILSKADMNFKVESSFRIRTTQA